MPGNIISHRGFNIQKVCNQGDVRYTAYWPAKSAFHIPRKFRWRAASKDALYDYIDALIRRDPKRIGFYEKKGYATDHEYDYDSQENVREISITPKRILEILTCQDPLCIPADSKVIIRRVSVPSKEKGVPRKHRYICTSFFAEVAALPWLSEEMRDSIKPFTLMEPEKIDGYSGHVFDEAAHTGLSLSEDPRLLETHYVDEEIKPAEVLVKEGELPEGRVEKIFLCETSEPYYIRRVYDDDDNMIRCETGWSIDGPWYGPEAYEEKDDG